jgi:hypothetical protein
MPGGHLGYSFATPQLGHRNFGVDASWVYPKGAVMHKNANAMLTTSDVLINVLIFLPLTFFLIKKKKNTGMNAEQKEEPTSKRPFLRVG